MRRVFLPLFIACLLLPKVACAWNAAGHRIVALIAWQQLDSRAQDWLDEALRHHPDREKWQQRARSTAPEAVFCEAATWADDIRSDPRYDDAGSEAITPPIPGLPDQDRHKDWHYVDLDDQGRVTAGQIDRQIDNLSRLLRSTAHKEQIAWALPWLIHLLGDIHQPLHVGRHGDEGGNAVEIENPANPRQPFTNLHSYWDDLPGPPWLRGKRLKERVAGLLAQDAAPVQGHTADWRDESHRLLAHAYPTSAGSLLPLADASFRQNSLRLAERQLLVAGYRLGRLLATIVRRQVSRETP